jgi:hypothetical protein
MEGFYACDERRKTVIHFHNGPDRTFHPSQNKDFPPSEVASLEIQGSGRTLTQLLASLPNGWTIEKYGVGWILRDQEGTAMFGEVLHQLLRDEVRS